MTRLRTLVSVMPVVLFAVMGLTGCYDLSTSGPHRDDFIRDNTATQTQQEQGQTPLQVHCGPTSNSPCNADTTSALLDALEESDGDPGAADPRRKIHVVADDAP